MWNLIYTLVNDGVLLYGFTVAVWYFFLAMMSMVEMRAYLKRNYFIDYSYILSSPFAPGISLLAPAYNESLTIIDNVKSLLSLMLMVQKFQHTYHT
jgi:cellulose synthase/poly-beta-1,6-N-acetylglucosamine synthase-like glycosyltransferase